jgi:hypothetical protein
MLFSKTRLSWVVPCSFHVPTIWLGLACVSPMLVKGTPCFSLLSNYIPEVLQGSLLVPPPQHGCWYCPPCTILFLLADRVRLFLSMHQSSPLFGSSRTNGAHHSLTLELGQGYQVYVCDSFTKGEVTWWTGWSLCANYSDVSYLQVNGVAHHFSSSSFRNLGMRFLLGGAVTSHVMKTLNHFH